MHMIGSRRIDLTSQARYEENIRNESDTIWRTLILSKALNRQRRNFCRKWQIWKQEIEEQTCNSYMNGKYLNVLANRSSRTASETGLR